MGFLPKMYVRDIKSLWIFPTILWLLYRDTKLVVLVPSILTRRCVFPKTFPSNDWQLKITPKNSLRCQACQISCQYWPTRNLHPIPAILVNLVKVLPRQKRSALYQFFWHRFEIFFWCQDSVDSTEVKVFTRRWYILGIFSVLACHQVLLCLVCHHQQGPTGRLFKYRAGSDHVLKKSRKQVVLGSGRSVEIYQWVFPGI